MLHNWNVIIRFYFNSIEMLGGRCPSFYPQESIKSYSINAIQIKLSLKLTTSFDIKHISANFGVSQFTQKYILRSMLRYHKIAKAHAVSKEEKETRTK